MSEIIDCHKQGLFDEAVAKFKPPVIGKLRIPYVLLGAWRVVYERPYVDPEKMTQAERDLAAFKAMTGSRSQGIGDQGHVKSLRYELFCHEFPSFVPEPAHFEHYIKEKGYLFLDYYFPFKEDLPDSSFKTDEPISGFEQILIMAEPNRPEPYHEIRKFCEGLKNSTSVVADLRNVQAEKEALEAEIAALKAQKAQVESDQDSGEEVKKRGRPRLASEGDS